MRGIVIAVVLGFVTAGAALLYLSTDSAHVVSAPSITQPPDVPAPRLGADGRPRASFVKAHANFVRIAKEGRTDLLFLGDSLTADWSRNGETWEWAFGTWRPANFGIPGDGTQHLLWRITNGELDGINPKVIVVLIGTNNVESDSVDGIAAGVARIVEAVLARLPKSKILLLAIFPRGEKVDGLREKVVRVNEQIARLADDKSVYFLDIGVRFLEPGGALNREVMPDLLHLSEKGYRIFADAIMPRLSELMR